VKISHKEFTVFSKFIEVNYGIKLKAEKKTMVIGRLHSLINSLGLTTLSEYLEYVVNDSTGTALVNLVNKITTNHTYFMRESEHFFYFRDHVMPFLKNTVRNQDLRIWCAACSSGEEPYTLSMIVDEFLGEEKIHWNSKMLATDISSRVLDIAREGIYPFDSIKEMPKIWKLNYFTNVPNEKVQVKTEIRRDVVYRKLNLMDDQFPFKTPFQVIFIRNVMIYFDEDTKEKLLNKLYNLLIPGGYLFIGHSETINRNKSKFKYIRPSVYRK